MQTLLSTVSSRHWRSKSFWARINTALYNKDTAFYRDRKPCL